jgi:hypothetical protein
MDRRHVRSPVGYDRAVLRRSDNPAKEKPAGGKAGGLLCPVPRNAIQIRDLMTIALTG